MKENSPNRPLVALALATVVLIAGVLILFWLFDVLGLSPDGRYGH